MSDCQLRRANGNAGMPCDEGSCAFWRAIEHLDLGVSSSEGCAVQHFALLENGNSDLAAWLLSVKQRVEGIQGE